MKKWGLMLFAIGLVAVAAILTTSPSRVEEPCCKGKSLSEWLNVFQTDRGINGGLEEVRQIGTNAIPWLLKWVRSDQPVGTNTTTYFEKAVLGFWMLGPKAKPALSELTRMSAEWTLGAAGMTNAERALLVLSYLGKDAALPLVTILTNTSAPLSLRRAAVYSIQSLGGEGDDTLPLLGEQFLNRETPVELRRAALEAAVWMQKDATNLETFVENVIPILQDTNAWLACAAAEAIASFDRYPNLAVPALTKSLHDPRKEVRYAALQSLGSFGNDAKSAIPILIDLTSDLDTRMRESVTNALLRIPDFAVPALIKNLQSGDQESRCQATMRIVDLGNYSRPAVPVLVKCLEDRDTKVAAYAAISLGRLALEPDLVVPALTNILQSTNLGLRNCGAKALGQFGTKANSALPHLRVLLDDPSEKVQGSAFDAIAKIDPAEARNQSK